MKTSTDPRHKKRIARIQSLYAYIANPEGNTSEITQVLSHLEKIDAKIATAAPNWPLTKINRVDLAILRDSVYAMLYDKKIPVGVIIDEAVEIGKEYGAESTPSFVNGVLGTIGKTI